MLTACFGRTRGTEDAVGKCLDLSMYDGKTKSLLRENPVGQVFLLIRAELLHDLGFVLAFRLAMFDIAVTQSRI